VARAVLASAVPPYLYKSDDNPDGGLDDATIETFQGGVIGDRLAFLDRLAQGDTGLHRRVRPHGLSR